MDYFKCDLNGYFGGKESTGTYQTIINEIPKHEVFVSACLGRCAILRKKEPARYNYGFELDKAVCDAWTQGANAPHLEIKNESYRGIPVADLLKLGRVFVYADPPYLKAARKNKKDVYLHEWRRRDHVNFIDWVKSLEGKENLYFAISHYPCDLYEKAFSKWRKLGFMSGTRNGQAKELLFMNYPKIAQLHDFRFIGKDYRKRERLKKKYESFTGKFAAMSPVLKAKIARHFISAYPELFNTIGFGGTSVNDGN